MHPLDAEFEKYWAELEPKLKALEKSTFCHAYRKGIDYCLDHINQTLQPKEQTKEAA